MNKVQEAERRIAGILADLEAETGQVVKELELRSLDITSIVDPVQQLQREVRIALWHVPGSHWVR